MPRFERARERMVERQIQARGVHDPRVLAAMRAVPRERFVADDVRDDAYEDRPLPIGAGQTISQPYIVAVMIEALRLAGGEKVLEVGAGSGYAAAVLGQIASEVWTIERLDELAGIARANLAAADCRNVHVLHGDGTQGWAKAAPYDAILVSAGAPDVPGPLLAQLAIGGRLVVPVGASPHRQTLVRVTRTGEADYTREQLGDVSFVPLIGKDGWGTPTGRAGRSDDDPAFSAG